jgi:hypothetical protein
MNICSDASTIVIMTSSGLHLVNVVKGYCTNKFSKYFQELPNPASNCVHNKEREQHRPQHKLEFVRSMRMHQLCVDEVGESSD